LEAFGSTYAVKIPAEKPKGELVLVVSDGKSPLEYKFREVPLKYTIDKDTLKIECKEPLQAGQYLGRSDISGTWVRAQAPAR
jgi:hypothetical protein